VNFIDYIDKNNAFLHRKVYQFPLFMHFCKIIQESKTVSLFRLLFLPHNCGGYCSLKKLLKFRACSFSITYNISFST